MNLSKIGEMGVIRSLLNQFSNLPSKNIIKGIGDDCAIIARDQEDIVDLVSTDMLVEGTHFLKDRISAYQLGYKSLAVNLSDIAAMGGYPQYVTLSLGLPRDTSSQWLNDFFRGFKYLAGQYNLSLVGGDTTKSSLVVINVTLVGTMKRKEVKLISDVKQEDILCVTGYLGDSSAGLRLILDGNHIVHSDVTRHLMNAHYRPNVHIDQGVWLARHEGVHAMTDISDGIGGEIRWMRELSKFGFTIELTKLPISGPLKKASKVFAWDPVHLALNGGEDYCLLVSIDKKHFNRISREFSEMFDFPLCPIGRAVENSQGIVYTYEGEQTTVFADGFDRYN